MKNYNKYYFIVWLLCIYIIKYNKNKVKIVSY